MDIKLLNVIRETGPGYLPLFCQITGVSEDEVHEYLDREQDGLIESQRWYTQEELLRVREAVESMKEDIPEPERKEMRRLYLMGKIRELKKHYIETGEGEKQLKQLISQVKLFTGEQKGVSGDEIRRAKQYPITELIVHRNYMAQCPFHPDDTPSLNIRNNYFFCHGCGASGDVIDFVRRTEGLSFPEAVLKLCI